MCVVGPCSAGTKGGCGADCDDGGLGPTARISMSHGGGQRGHVYLSAECDKALFEKCHQRTARDGGLVMRWSPVNSASHLQPILGAQ